MGRGDTGVFNTILVESPGGPSILRGGSGIENPKALPNVASASIPEKKLSGYALNSEHPIGRNKARVFKAALGFTDADAASLERQIILKLPFYPASIGKKDQYGQRYTVDMPITGKNGQTRIIRTGWIIKTGESSPTLTTAYVL